MEHIANTVKDCRVEKKSHFSPQLKALCMCHIHREMLLRNESDVPFKLI